MPPASRTPRPSVERSAKQLLELNLGATAVGTGLNAGDDYRRARHRGILGAYTGRGAAGREPVPRDAEHG